MRAQREIGWEPRPCALEDRRLDSVTRCATIEEAASGSPGPFSWVVPPVRNWNTRLAAEMRDGHQTATSLARHPPRCTARARALGSSPRQRSASAAWTAICFSENGRTSVRRMPRRQYPASSPGAAALDSAVGSRPIRPERLPHSAHWGTFTARWDGTELRSSHTRPIQRRRRSSAISSARCGTLRASESPRSGVTGSIMGPVRSAAPWAIARSTSAGSGAPDRLCGVGRLYRPPHDLAEPVSPDVPRGRPRHSGNRNCDALHRRHRLHHPSNGFYATVKRKERARGATP